MHTIFQIEYIMAKLAYYRKCAFFGTQKLKNEIEKLENECIVLCQKSKKIGGRKWQKRVIIFFHILKKLRVIFPKWVVNRNKVESNINQVSRNINIFKSVNGSNIIRFLELLLEYKSIIKHQNKLMIKACKE
ncbi:hypothetical protein BKP44_11515 [Formosa algae]|nr:hypothetical protein BKP44_11515 [Formosa algae]